MYRIVLCSLLLCLPVAGWTQTLPDTEAAEISDLAVSQSPRPQARRPIVLPNARWGDANGRNSWTHALVAGLRSHAKVLPTLVPNDIQDWCPAYPTAGAAGREAFWVGLISALAWHESTHRPTAVGGGGRWFGLVQIYPPTARFYKCKARSGAALKDPEDNLSCALRIMAVTVPRDGVVSRGMKGVAADWGPFHSRRKREDMRAWVRGQEYCQGLTSSLRPVARPEVLTSQAPDSEPKVEPQDPEIPEPSTTETDG